MDSHDLQISTIFDSDRLSIVSADGQPIGETSPALNVASGLTPADKGRVVEALAWVVRSGEEHSLTVTRDEQLVLMRMAPYGPSIAVLEVDLGSIAQEREHQQAHDTHNAVKRFAGRMAHDINNALVSFISYPELIEAETASPVILGYIEELRRAADSLQNISARLQAISGKKSTNRQECDLNVIVQSSKGSERVHFELAPNLTPLCVDIAQLKDVYESLVENAFEAVEQVETPRVEVRTFALDVSAPLWGAAGKDTLPTGGYVVLEVADNGHGMTPENRRHAYEPYYSTRAPRRGLGLTRVRDVMESHGGMVRIVATETGCVVRAFFPVKRANDCAASDATSPSVDLNALVGKAILVADDQPGVCALCRDVLEEAGAMVLTAEDGTRAIEVAETLGHKLELAIVDLNMPTMNGDEVITNLVLSHPELKLVLMSGHHPESFAVPAVQLGAALFLPKPFSSEQLLSACAQAVTDEQKRDISESLLSGTFQLVSRDDASLVRSN